MVLVQCSQVSRSYNGQQCLLGGGVALCHVSCAHKPAQCGHRDVQLEAGGTSWGGGGHWHQALWLLGGGWVMARAV